MTKWLHIQMQRLRTWWRKRQQKRVEAQIHILDSETYTSQPLSPPIYFPNNSPSSEDVISITLGDINPTVPPVPNSLTPDVSSAEVISVTTDVVDSVAICVICAEPLYDGRQLTNCPGCKATLHDECFSEHGCGTAGCRHNY